MIAATVALTRTWRGRVILLVLASQLLLPLLYYVGRRDPHDERFAWRMFSPMREAKCATHYTLDDKPVPLERLYHEAWLSMLERGRFGVIEAMGADLCAKHPGARVGVTVDCTYLDRPKHRFGTADLCTQPELGWHGE